MTVECPAPDCDFTGMVDQVAGHIGGSNDALHDGVVPSMAREGQPGGGGLSPVVMLAGVAVAVGFAFLVLDVDLDGGSNTGREEPERHRSQQGLMG